MNREIWHPPLYEKADIRAIQALAEYAAGTGAPPSPTECMRALDWIINTAASTYDEPFRPGHPDVVAYMLGRRSVGLAIVKLTKLKPGILDRHEQTDG